MTAVIAMINPIQVVTFVPRPVSASLVASQDGSEMIDPNIAAKKIPNNIPISAMILNRVSLLI